MDATSPLLPSIDPKLLFDAIDNLHEAVCIAEAIRNENFEIIDFRYLYINKAGAKDNESSCIEITGKKYSEILPSFRSNELFNIYKNAILKQKYFSLESTLFIEETDGRKIRDFYNIKGTPHGDQLYLTWENITRHRLLLENLEKRALEAEESKNTLNAILEYIPHGLTIADAPDAKIRAVSRWEQRLSGISEKNTEKDEGWAIYDLDGREVETFNRPLESAILRGEVVKDKELIMKLPGGRRIFISTDAGPILNNEGDIIGGLASWRDITEKKRMDLAIKLSEIVHRELTEELRRDRDKLQKIIETMPIGLGIFDKSGKVVIVNEYSRIIHGVSNQGEMPADYDTYIQCYEFRDPEGNLIEPGEWPVSRSLRGEYVQNFEAVIINKTNYIQHFVAYTVVPLSDREGNIYEIMHVMEDITERKKQEKMLSENREILQRIIDTVPAMISIYDPELNISHMNEAFERISGWTKEDFENNGMMELLYPNPHYREMVNEFVSSLRAGFKDLKMTTKDGAIIDTSWANVELPDGKIVSIGIDISERKAIEQKLVETMKMLERSNKDLEQFAYAASHDLQSPLNQIKGFSQLLIRKYKDSLDSDAGEYLVFINSAVTRMTQLIQGLLEFSRITSKSKMHYVVTRNVINTALSNLELYIKEQNAKVTLLDIHDVTGDTILLMQLFQNLIQNGIKFHKVRPPEVIISSNKVKDEIIFSVSDNGIGIAPEYYERVFMIFQRLHDEASYPGTGIGLAICKRIVEHHHGRIWVESEVGKGTTFYFSLPAG